MTSSHRNRDVSHHAAAESAQRQTPNYTRRRIGVAVVAAVVVGGPSLAIHEVSKPIATVTSTDEAVPLNHGGIVTVTKSERASRLDRVIDRSPTSVTCVTGMGEVSNWEGVSLVAADVVDAAGAPLTQSNIVPVTGELKRHGGLDGGNSTASNAGDPVAVPRICFEGKPGTGDPMQAAVDGR